MSDSCALFIAAMVFAGLGWYGLACIAFVLSWFAPKN